MGKAEIMLKVLSSPDVDAASITAMLGDSSDDPVVQQLLALRAGWDAPTVATIPSSDLLELFR